MPDGCDPDGKGIFYLKVNTMIHVAENVVYCLKNKVNNKLYIGSSSNYKQRKISHLESLMNKCHHNPILQKDFNEFGKENFVFEILKQGFKTVEKMLEHEYYLINNSSNIYNVLKVNYNGVGLRKSKTAVYQMKNQQMSVIIVSKNKKDVDPTKNLSKKKATKWRKDQSQLKRYDQAAKERAIQNQSKPTFKRIQRAV